jgi:hypothetical protein
MVERWGIDAAQEPEEARTHSLANLLEFLANQPGSTLSLHSAVANEIEAAILKSGMPRTASLLLTTLSYWPASKSDVYQQNLAALIAARLRGTAWYILVPRFN